MRECQWETGSGQIRILIVWLHGLILSEGRVIQSLRDSGRAMIFSRL